jgi:hypothetical protein
LISIGSPSTMRAAPVAVSAWATRGRKIARANFAVGSLAP